MFTETWLSPSDGVALNETCLPGFNYFHLPRLSGCGGGLAVIILNVPHTLSEMFPQLNHVVLC